jgi:hypothetical protein
VKSWSRILVAGILAGAVINAIEWVAHRVWLDERWLAAFAAMGRKPAFWSSFVVANFLVGIFAVWTYRWLSGIYGATRATRLKSATAIWLVFWVIPIGGLQPFNFFPNYLLALVVVVGIADVALGVLPALALFDRLSTTTVALLLGFVCLAPSRASAQHTHIRVDSVLLARDFNGNGKTDYVVRETSRGSISEIRPVRLAVYLDGKPLAHKATWASEWDDLQEMQTGLDSSYALSPGLTLLEIGGSGGDYGFSRFLLVQGNKVREELSMGVDYGEGYMNVTQLRDSVVVVVTDAHLELRGKALASADCPGTKWSARRLVYDRTKQRFTAGSPYCMDRKY